MPPTDALDIVPPGVEALRWAASRRRRCAQFWHDPRAVRAALGPVLAGAEDLWDELARRVLDAAGELEELADRIGRRTPATWRSGEAAAFLTAVDVDWIAREAAALELTDPLMPLPEAVVGTGPERRRAAAALRVLAGWLGPYLARHP